VVQVLGRRQADGSSLIRVEAMRDGIVAFEDEADSHRYAAMLEAEGTMVRLRIQTLLHPSVCLTQGKGRGGGSHLEAAMLEGTMVRRSARLLHPHRMSQLKTPSFPWLTAIAVQRAWRCKGMQNRVLSPTFVGAIV